MFAMEVGVYTKLGEGLSVEEYCFNRSFGNGDEKCFTTENTEIQEDTGAFQNTPWRLDMIHNRVL